MNCQFCESKDPPILFKIKGQVCGDCIVALKESPALLARCRELEEMVRELVDQMDCTNIASSHRRIPLRAKAMALVGEKKTG